MNRIASGFCSFNAVTCFSNGVSFPLSFNAVYFFLLPFLSCVSEDSLHLSNLNLLLGDKLVSCFLEVEVNSVSSWGGTTVLSLVVSSCRPLCLSLCLAPLSPLTNSRFVASLLWLVGEAEKLLRVDSVEEERLGRILSSTKEKENSRSEVRSRSYFTYMSVKARFVSLWFQSMII